MSSSSKSDWLDRWWPLFLIVFGAIFVTCLVSFKPFW
jgi:hypothetical protein